MVHTFVYEDARWRAETTGFSREADGRNSAGIVFIHEPTGRHINGRLDPADIEKPTDERLGDALAAALAKLRQKPPTVRKAKADNGTEGFAIDHVMYVGFKKDPTIDRPGYIGTDFHVIIDEATARRDLSMFFGLSDEAIDERIDKAAF